MGEEVPKMMTCMKCGRAVALGQAFCKDCLEDMSHYPVNPSTPVHIPMEPPMQTPKQIPRPQQVRKPEENTSHLREGVRFLTFGILLLLVMLLVLGGYAVKKLYPRVQSFGPGQNYITTEVSKLSDPLAE